MLDADVRVTNAGLKVVLFSRVCGMAAGVANKEVSGGQFRQAMRGLRERRIGNASVMENFSIG